MGGSEKFCLRWNDFETNISVAFRELREDKDFFDVTLACDDSQIQAHKVILSACSPFFRNVLRKHPHQHPLLYLKGVSYNEILSVLNFMYLGEVNVAQEELNSFLEVAESLKVKGLTQGRSNSNDTLHVDQTRKSSTMKNTNPASENKPPAPLQPREAHTTHTRDLSQNNYTATVDDEIQEVVPVKSEPKEAPQNHVHYGEQQYDPHHGGGGTIALENSYTEEGYDEYGQYDTVYQDGGYHGQMETVGTETNKDLEILILSKMSKNKTGDWQCNDCYKTSKVKTNIFEHIEANHVDSPGYQCELCYKFCRTRNALRNHKNFKQ